MRIASLLVLALAGCGLGGEPPAPDPGTVTLRRLTRTDIDRSLRDLFQIDAAVALDLPTDDVGNGFDNQANVLTVSPLHIELMDGISHQVVTQHVFPTPLPVVYQRVEAESDAVDATVGGFSGAGWMLWANGTLSTQISVDHAGTYQFTVNVFGTQAGDEPVLMQLDHDGDDAVDVEVPWSSLQPVTVEWELLRGTHTVNVRFLNDFYQPDLGLDRNLLIDWVELGGPIGGFAPEPPGYDAVFSCQPDSLEEPACARQIARDFGEKVWRRPLDETEVSDLVSLYEQARETGDTPQDAVGWLVRGLLMSPHFLYRVELDPDPLDPTSHELTPYELATRLSYFLWSSTPDDELLARARSGRLSNEDELLEQVDRMLADPRAQALVSGLGSQWLSVRAIDDAFPEPVAFPEWNEVLRQSMAQEMERQIGSILLEDRSMRDLLLADTTFIDQTLAVHYGLPEPESGWEEVSIADTERQGLLTTGGWLTATSYPERTSPVRRGKWVLDNLLCEAPAPPPPGVEALDDEDPDTSEDADTDAGSTQSVRERLEAHRSDPTCQSCHQSIDPIGFAFEHFDPIGAWRNTDNGQPVDASAQLPDGTRFEGANDLVTYVAQSRKFDRCVVQKTTTWALGRAPTGRDLPYLDAIEQDYVAGDRRFRALVHAIVLSEPFRTRRGQPAPTLEAGDE